MFIVSIEFASSVLCLSVAQLYFLEGKPLVMQTITIMFIQRLCDPVLLPLGLLLP